MSQQGLTGSSGRKTAVAMVACLALFPMAAFSNPLLHMENDSQIGQPSAPMMTGSTTVGPSQSATLPENLRRRIVNYQTMEPSGTIVIDTAKTYLYYVLHGSKAIRYGIGVGREGYTWSGIKFVGRKAEWPDWFPPADMISRQPYLPRLMAGGPQNPLGARAIYLSGTLYRIHGTNAPATIGRHVSSGCIRMLNEDVIDLYTRVSIGTKVVVLPMSTSGAVQTAGVANRSDSGSLADATNMLNAFGIY